MNQMALESVNFSVIEKGMTVTENTFIIER